MKDELECEVCDTEFLIERYGRGKCPRCETIYQFDDARYVIVLSAPQKRALRRLMKDPTLGHENGDW